MMIEVGGSRESLLWEGYVSRFLVSGVLGRIGWCKTASSGGGKEKMAVGALRLRWPVKTARRLRQVNAGRNDLSTGSVRG